MRLPGETQCFWLEDSLENGKVQSRLPKKQTRSGKIITLEFLEKNQILVFLNEFQRYDFSVPGPFFWQSTLNLAIFRQKMNFETKTLHFREKHIFLPQKSTKSIVSLKICVSSKTDAGKSTLEPLPHAQVLEARTKKAQIRTHLLRPIAYTLRRKSLRLKPELRRQFRSRFLAHFWLRRHGSPV